MIITLKWMSVGKLWLISLIIVKLIIQVIKSKQPILSIHRSAVWPGLLVWNIGFWTLTSTITPAYSCVFSSFLTWEGTPPLFDNLFWKSKPHFPWKLLTVLLYSVVTNLIAAKMVHSCHGWRIILAHCPKTRHLLGPKEKNSNPLALGAILGVWAVIIAQASTSL